MSAFVRRQRFPFQFVGRNHEHTFGPRVRNIDYPAIPWKQIIGMRNRLVHAYSEIDYEQVWKALTEDLPPLIEQWERILADELEPG